MSFGLSPSVGLLITKDQTMQFFLFVGTLTVGHILELSRRTTSELQVRELGTIVLGLKEHIVDATINEKDNKFTLAALQLLKTWDKSKGTV